MKSVLILGAGMVARPIIRYLLENQYKVTVTSLDKAKAEELVGGHENGIAMYWSVEDEETLHQLIESHDLTVSLLPWAYHVKVAKLCIEHKTNMVTTSYVKPEMHDLDQAAKDAGIIILNEIGVDPGIDHMSAMRIIDHVHEKGGEIEEFCSITGALCAPESTNDNPFRYKFTWSPKGVVLASNNDARYLYKGKEVKLPSEQLFKRTFIMDFPEVGKLKVYANRDSIDYIDIYGIPEVKTIYRGTYRYLNWCRDLDMMKTLNLISCDTHDFTGKTYAEFVGMMIGESGENIREKVAKHLNISVDAEELDAIEWLGLFDDKAMNRKEDQPFEITSDLMIEKMMIGKDERDMVAMQHVFLAKYPSGHKEVIKSRLLEFGTLATDTSIARTVSLPAAVAVKLILEEKIKIKGVYRPTLPQIYNPVLDELESLNIKMIEEYGLPESENIQPKDI